MGIFCHTHRSPGGALPPDTKSTASTSAASSPHENVLPTHPGLINQRVEGLTKGNKDWVKSALVLLSFMYCVSWSEPVCVRMGSRLTMTQEVVVTRMALLVDCFLEQGAACPRFPSLLQASSRIGTTARRRQLSIQALNNAKVIKAWPAVGNAAAVRP